MIRKACGLVFKQFAETIEFLVLKHQYKHGGGKHYPVHEPEAAGRDANIFKGTYFQNLFSKLFQTYLQRNLKTFFQTYCSWFLSCLSSDESGLHANPPTDTPCRLQLAYCDGSCQQVQLLQLNTIHTTQIISTQLTQLNAKYATQCRDVDTNSSRGTLREQTGTQQNRTQHNSMQLNPSPLAQTQCNAMF